MSGVIRKQPEFRAASRFALSPLINSVWVDRSKRPLQSADLAEGRLRLDRLWLNGVGPLSSPDGYAVIPRANNKVSRRRPALR
jgi:hypothetical protein